MIFHHQFPHVPILGDTTKRFFANKALEYYTCMGEGSLLQEKYAIQKREIDQLLFELK